MPPYLSELHQRVERWSKFGVRSYGDGTRLVGHFPERGAGYYIHSMFGPLDDELLEQVEDRLQLQVPEELREFFSFHNGCIFFERNVFVFGVRRSYDRSDFDAMACNPFDILAPTAVNLRRSPSGSGVTICAYQDGTVVLLEPDGKVIRLEGEGSGRILNNWNGFGDWLVSEYRRIEALFDESGRSLVGSLKTPPPLNGGG